MRIIVPLGVRSSMLSIWDAAASFLPFAFLPDVAAKEGTYDLLHITALATHNQTIVEPDADLTNLHRLIALHR